MSDTPLGRFCWYELMTTDPEAAKAFYGKVAGWTTETGEAGGQPYTMWKSGEQPIGGVMELPAEAAAAGAPPHWIAYVSTPDCEATVAKVEKLGGSTTWGPMHVPSVGRFAGLADPQGAMFAVLESDEEAPMPGTDDPPPVGMFSWNELATSDWRSAWTFYCGVFDWSDAGDFDMGDMGLYQMFGNRTNVPDGAESVGGMFDKPAEMPVAAWLHYIRVADLDAAVEAVTANGGIVANGPMEVPGGDRVAQCIDPQGVMFALHATAD